MIYRYNSAILHSLTFPHARVRICEFQIRSDLLIILKSLRISNSQIRKLAVRRPGTNLLVGHYFPFCVVLSYGPFFPPPSFLVRNIILARTWSIFEEIVCTYAQSPRSLA